MRGLHKQLLKTRIPGMFKDSTEHVMHVALPKLVRMDDAHIQEKLLFDLAGTSKAMLEKARCYSKQQLERMCVEVNEGEGEKREGILLLYPQQRVHHVGKDHPAPRTALQCLAHG